MDNTLTNTNGLEPRFFLIQNDFLLYGSVAHSLRAGCWLTAKMSETSNEPKQSIAIHKIEMTRATFTFKDVRLNEGSTRMLNSPNAGGNSMASEVLSFEVLSRLMRARLQKTEMEIKYYPAHSKITDYSIAIDGITYGVSVTRAMKFRGIFTEIDAEKLLRKKLYGVVVSSNNVCTPYKWEKQILHVWAQHEYIASIVADVFAQMEESLRTTTLVLITICSTSFSQENARGKVPDTIEDCPMSWLFIGKDCNLKHPNLVKPTKTENAHLSTVPRFSISCS